MKDIILKVPTEFTLEQTEFIKKSAQLQMESEMRKTLKVPQADIDTVEWKIEQLRIAQGIAKEAEPVAGKFISDTLRSFLES